ncbi:phosphatidylglycerol lysyltransferase domain-containing protein [Streptomyces endophyticus]|uniref:Phosphatidylglycerol lysyltransferase domain-containing protein n=1 Tax=Streptomyces endophyticus TaxID=714166 RepID=A0ABU6F3T1_9ACTN|nr:phosphatidylglycerol lysyltransferase domain-containing protein [Streptomyces endophyticus]MEB8338297.1 phosphatidylglycerol lysyltransferase domain-containing protein [Streptomyces endophyticus]
MKPRTAAIAGHTCLLIGLVDIATAVSPHMRASRIERLAPYVPGLTEDVARAAALVSGVLLVLLARGLRRGKRRAWEAAVALLAVSALVQGLRHHAFVAATVSALLCGGLVLLRGEFRALSDPRGRARALGNLLLLGTISVGLGLLIVGVRADHEAGQGISFVDRIKQVAYGLVGMAGPLTYDSDRIGDAVSVSLLALGLLTASTTVYLALRPVRLAPGDGDARVRALLAREGRRDSLGYFALRGDKAVQFSATGKAAVAYRVVSGVAVVGGDPLGDPEAWPGAIKEFLDRCARHAWTPAVMGCSELGAQIWMREGGLKALELGDEAIVDCAGFSLAGRAMRNVRQMVNRIERGGYSCRVRRVRELADEEKQQLREAAAAWRGSATERGFSMALGRFGDPADSDCVVVTAHQQDADGTQHVRALLHFVPWGEDGLSLDLMRRDRTAEPGLNELLIIAALRAAPGLGIARVSLNFAVFRAALARGERIGAGPVLKGWRGLLVFLSRWFQIESLYRFNAKFRPQWQPRFVVYPTARDLPRIGWACLQAEAFVVLPRPAERLRQWTHHRSAGMRERGSSAADCRGAPFW